MQYMTHNDLAVNINGTHLQGECCPETTFDRLFQLFGEPTTGDDYKTDWEWEIEFDNGQVATIYNWKSGPNYGFPDTTPADLTGRDWHIGGFDKVVVEMINDLIKES